VPRLVLLAALLALLAGCSGDGSSSSRSSSDAGEPAAESALGPPALVEALRGGGYVLYLRHGATDMTQKDTHKTDVSRCDGMRNLTRRGREQMRDLGIAVAELRIPIGAVRSSAYCRTRNSATLAFGRYVIESALTGFPEPGESDYASRLRTTQRLLARRPTEGRNTVLVAHVKNLEAAADRTIDEGELAVFEPLDGTSFRYRGRIPASAWPQLAAQLRRAP
jgi:phosphohistidine phosphatase SixA